jgi:hypothetical protein
MRLLNFAKGGGIALGARRGETVVDLTAAGVAGSVDELLRQGADGLAYAKAALEAGKVTVPFAGLTLKPPVLAPAHSLYLLIN